jgi:hypothetical protein
LFFIGREAAEWVPRVLSKRKAPCIPGPGPEQAWSRTKQQVVSQGEEKADRIVGVFHFCRGEASCLCHCRVLALKT